MAQASSSANPTQTFNNQGAGSINPTNYLAWIIGLAVVGFIAWRLLKRKGKS